MYKAIILLKVFAILPFLLVVLIGKGGPDSRGNLACCALKNIPSVMDTVSRKGLQGMFYNDSCCFLLLDSIYTKCVYDKKYLVYIDSISDISDGYLSEALDGANANLFLQHFDLFFPYLSKRLGSQIYNLTIAGLYFYTLDKPKKEIDAFFKAKKDRFKKDKPKLDFLTQMQKDFTQLTIMLREDDTHK